MSLQWTFVATFLYTEIFLVALLLLPWISPSRWQKIFKSRILNNIGAHATLYFNILIAVLVIFFLDSIRDIRKYSAESDSHEAGGTHQTLDHEVAVHMRLFRAQRNFYIAGFALFLFLVLRRLVVLISNTAQLEAQSEASLKQAKSASEAAQKMMEDNEKDKERKDNKANESKVSPALGNIVEVAATLNSTKKELDQSRLDLEKTREELHHSNMDLESMRKQAQATNKEYDRLLEEHSKVQSELAALQGDGDKKDL